MKSEIVHFDVRTKAVLLLEMNVLLLWRSGLFYETALILLSALILLLGGKARGALRFSILFLGMVLVQLFLQPPEAVSFSLPAGLAAFSESFLGSLVLFVVVSLRRFIPILMIGSLLLSTRVGEFVACMWKMKVPRDAIITLSVVFRFFPTVKEEWQAILSSMKMRGIGHNAAQLLRHPLRTVEYLMVPLLINAVKISEELSEAALCRGLDCTGTHTSLIRVRMRLGDYAFCAIPILFAVLIRLSENMGGRLLL